MEDESPLYEQPANDRNVFREMEKFYRTPAVDKRGRRKQTDFTDVIDFYNLENNTLENQKLIQKVKIVPKPSPHFTPFTEAFTITSVPGSPFPLFYCIYVY